MTFRNVVKEDYQFISSAPPRNKECEICGIISFSHFHKKGTLPKDYSRLVGCNHDVIISRSGGSDSNPLSICKKCENIIIEPKKSLSVPEKLNLPDNPPFGMADEDYNFFLDVESKINEIIDYLNEN